MERLNIKIKRINAEFNDVQLPEYATPGSAGMDIRAAINDEVVIKPREIKVIPTNLCVEISEGYEIQVRARSGLAAKHGIGILNAPGTIDSDFRGEIKIILVNLGKADFKVFKGDRIAQLVVNKVYKANFILSDDLNDSQRGGGGFGHTGQI